MVSPKGASESKHSRVIVNLASNPTTLVILFGWAGCHDRYLKKYSDYYEKAGISTIRFTTPIKKIRRYQSYSHFAKKFHREVLEKNEHANHPNIYFHCFSMNGCSTFTALWDLLDKKPDGDAFKKRVQGIIFDSSPAFTTPAQSANAISFASMPPSKYHAVFRQSYRAVLYAYFSVHHCMVWIWSLMEEDIYERCYAYYHLLSLKDLPMRQIYFYGPGDDVCSAESIEAFATIQEQRGAQTAHHVWKDSLHCQHYRSHSDEYEQHCIDFVLRRSDGDSPTKASVSMSALELCSEPQSALPVASS